MTSGNPRIDGLVAGAPDARQILPGDGDAASVGLVQDMLRGHGFSRLPDPRHGNYGAFGPLTRAAILDYRASCGLEPQALIDNALLSELARRPAREPVAARGYLALSLEIGCTPLVEVISLVSLFESGGCFACMNLNTDRAGLSFGIIQWAQKPGRLHELLCAFGTEAPAELAAALGDGLAGEALLAHTALPWGGVNPSSGEAISPRFDLVRDPWKARFRAMGLARELQRVQVRTAQAAFGKSLARLRTATPLLSSQRGSAFLLDLTNQHGDGGARAIYVAAARDGMEEAEVLAAMEEESVRRVAAQFGADSAEVQSTRSRREFFRTTEWLADAEMAG